MLTSMDLCLHELVRVRLLDATASDIAAVQRQTGLEPQSVAGTADITVRFVDPLPDLHNLRILEDWEAGYTRHGFWVLRGNHNHHMAARYPFDEFGQPCEILCGRPIDNLPLLQPLINLTALAKGYLPLHASAFEYNGNSVLVTGWAKGGKTEALLGFADHGATYVGDEWIYLSNDGRRMYGIPQRIQLWDWHLDSRPQRGRLSRSQRWKLSLTRRLQGWSDTKLTEHFLSAKNARRLGQWVHRRRHVRLTPKQLFGERIKTTVDCPQQLFFMASHAPVHTIVQSMRIGEVIERMAVSLEDEFSELLSYYRRYRFAFPRQRNDLLDNLPLVLEQRLEEVLGDKTAHAVWHPYPVSPRDLFTAMQPYVDDSQSSSSRTIPNSAVHSCVSRDTQNVALN